MDVVTRRLCPVLLDQVLVAAAIAVGNAASMAAVVAAVASAVDVAVVTGVVIAMATVVLTAHHPDLAATTDVTETEASPAVGTIRAAADARTTTDLAAATETVVATAETAMVVDAPVATWSPSADAMAAVVVVAIATGTEITIDLGTMTVANVATKAATTILASSVDTKSLLSGHPVGRRFHCNPYSICPFLRTWIRQLANGISKDERVEYTKRGPVPEPAAHTQQAQSSHNWLRHHALSRINKANAQRIGSQPHRKLRSGFVHRHNGFAKYQPRPSCYGPSCGDHRHSEWFLFFFANDTMF